MAGQLQVAVVRGATTKPSITAPNVPPGPWTPPQWNKPATYMLTVNPLPPRSSTAEDGTAMLSIQPSLIYVFDAVLRARHNQTLQITEHPVQDGANISDHAYLLPFRLTLDIGISDAMAQYTSASSTGANNTRYQKWNAGGSSSKSVSAYQTLLNIQESRRFLTLTTRLATYGNMLIESVAPEESHETIASLRATVTFKQVFTGTVSTVEISARPNATDDTQQATVQPSPIPPAVSNQYAVAAPSDPIVPGSGAWSSSTQGINNAAVARPLP